VCVCACVCVCVCVCVKLIDHKNICLCARHESSLYGERDFKASFIINLLTLGCGERSDTRTGYFIHLYPSNTRLSVPHRRSGSFGQKSRATLRIRTTTRLFLAPCQHVILTELHRITKLTFNRLMIYIYIYIYIYMCRTAPLTSRRCILYIYSTNARTEYFKHAAHSPFFPLIS
jgi:hypothetical protein